MPFVDSDQQVEARTGRTVREIFETDGEAAFRFEERTALLEALAAPEPTVIAAAGGVVLDASNRDLLRALPATGGQVVWLKASPAVLAERVGSADHRPLLGSDPAAVLDRLDTEREALYQSVATIVIDEQRGTRVMDVDQVAAAVRSRLLDPGRP